MQFLKQLWYIAGRANEVEHGKILARTIADTPAILWRDADGPVAMLDRCPHRLAPLSLGKLECEGIRCGYHGIRYGRDGKCNDNPHGPVLNALRVQTFPVMERHSFLWLWLGESEQADAAKIPDLSFIDRCPETAVIEGYLPTNANHQLLVDNILDLSHADYLHPDTLGGGSTTRAHAKVEQSADRLKVRWEMKDDIPFPIHRSEMPTPHTRVNQFLEVLWYPSGVMTLENEFEPVGTDQPKYNIIGVHAMIPESQFRTHYFYTITRDYYVDNAPYSELVAAGLRAAFLGEDKVMIEAQQERIGPRDIADSSPTLLSTDAGGIQARRIYARHLLAEEESYPIVQPHDRIARSEVAG
jgi:phenylpropionate dioxygenase-like ring-hydroxylating dioxygenase large terminal subunit